MYFAAVNFKYNSECVGLIRWKLSAVILYNKINNDPYCYKRFLIQRRFIIIEDE